MNVRDRLARLRPDPGPFDPYRPVVIVPIVALATAVGILLYVVSPTNPTTAIVGSLTTAGLLIAVANFLYARTDMVVSLEGRVVRAYDHRPAWSPLDVPTVRLTARIAGGRPLKPVDVQVRDSDGAWISVWEHESPPWYFHGIGDRLEHGAELYVEFRRDRLLEKTGHDWPRVVRIVDSFGRSYVRTFAARVD